MTAHYKSPAGIEAWDVIEAFGLNYNLGNVVKYVLRAGKKDEETFAADLQKAITYLERELSLRGGRPSYGATADSSSITRYITFKVTRSG